MLEQMLFKNATECSVDVETKIIQLTANVFPAASLHRATGLAHIVLNSMRILPLALFSTPWS